MIQGYFTLSKINNGREGAAFGSFFYLNKAPQVFGPTMPSIFNRYHKSWTIGKMMQVLDG
jgi:hypothetical protein